MKIGVNELHQTKQVREITDTALTIIDLDESADDYQFRGWSDTRLLCYCYVDGGDCISWYPYIDTNIIDKLEANAMTLDIIQGALNDLIMGVV